MAVGEPTRRLRELRQSLWLDGVSRPLLASGALSRFLADLSVTGLGFNQEVFELTVLNGNSYDASIQALAVADLSEENNSSSSRSRI